LGTGEVVITGWVSDEVLRALYQQARLFVLPSLSEGSGCRRPKPWRVAVPA
jgi:glycosyltransferase involved in cell wall biosynthesis